MKKKIRFFMMAFAIITMFSFSSCEEVVDSALTDYIDKAEWGDDNHKIIHVYYANLILPDNLPSDPSVEAIIYKANGKIDFNNTVVKQVYNRSIHKYNEIKLKYSVEQGGYVFIKPSSDNDKLMGSFTLKYE